MHIEPADRADFDDMVDLIVTRNPMTTRAEAGWMFTAPGLWRGLVAMVARDDDGTMIGVARLATGAQMPVGWTSIRVVVSSEHEGAGVGAALLAALDATWPVGATQLRSTVYDDDPRSLAVARHWGFEVEEHSITCRRALTDLPAPRIPDGVSLESMPRLDPPDVDAVEAMLLASQTNPEADFGVVMTLASLQASTGGSHPVAVIARVGGEPAAIVVGSVVDDSLFIDYTGVDPRFRGRGLAVLVKQQAHLDAAAAGARWSVTSNEVDNHGIRRINAELGYQVTYGGFRLRRVL